MSVQVLIGSKLEIAKRLAAIEGEIREAIVFVDEPVPHSAPSSDIPPGTVDIFEEMRPVTVNVPAADDSREAIYSRLEDE